MTESQELGKLRTAFSAIGGETKRVECKLGGFPDLVVTIERFTKRHVHGGDSPRREVSTGARVTFLAEAKRPQSKGPWSTFGQLRMRPGQIVFFLTWPGEHYILAWCQFERGWWAYKRLATPTSTRLDELLASKQVARVWLGSHDNSAVLMRNASGILWDSQQL